MGILPVALGEGSSEGILIDAAELEEDLHYRQRHMSVVRPRPRAERQLSRIGGGLPEEELTEGVAYRKALETAQGQVRPAGHGRTQVRCWCRVIRHVRLCSG